MCGEERKMCLAAQGGRNRREGSKTCEESEEKSLACGRQKEGQHRKEKQKENLSMEEKIYRRIMREKKRENVSDKFP